MLSISSFSYAQQEGDPDFKYETASPLFLKGTGPKVAIDEGHNNFHTLSGRYASFAQVLTTEGFSVTAVQGTIDKAKLMNLDVLVISNPIHESNLGNWVLPNPSAYTESEISAINDWVKSGGSLFLIADHMPFGGAASDLATSFGFNFTNGFARFQRQNGFETFKKKANTLVAHEVTEGIEKVMTFTGQAFEIPSQAEGLLKFPKGSYSLEPDTAWQFNRNTFSRPIDGWYQGALLDYGTGKVAVFGEAAMFTTQLVFERKMKVGMNTKGAKKNAQFLKNVMAWLSKD